jgi:uncharacterized protein DUF4440
MKSVIFSFVLLLSLSSIHAQTREPEQLPHQSDSTFLSLDNSLSESMKQNAALGLLAYISDKGALFDGRAVVDKQSLKQYITEAFGESFALELVPNEAHTVSEDMGYTSGTYSLKGKWPKCGCNISRSGRYLLVWQRERGHWREKGQWHIKAWIPSPESRSGCACGVS